MGFSTLCHDDNDITQISFPRSVFLTDKKNKLLAINFTVPRCRGAGVAGQCPGAVEVQQAEAAVALVGEVEAVLRIVALRLALTEVVHGLGVDKDPLDELIENGANNTGRTEFGQEIKLPASLLQRSGYSPDTCR